ncbi:hypothetical protein BJY01DRAFT_243364 [Aspergillus pseudoustus]|uniref:Ricin B lectin n=1 Tax=Aspergillus pseudoustus TaxID=1810923 RepID=A0ABR4KSX8_9EURO
MHLPLLTTLLALCSHSTALITWTLAQSSNPTAEESTAYSLISAAMTSAVARHTRLGSATKNIHVSYVPGVPTAEANYDGTIRFGSNTAYMNERTALHEISHTLGIGQTAAFNERCASNDWPGATALLQSWDGADARINCGGGHIWPYGLNYDNEWSETNADRHVLLVNEMIEDGM